MKALNIAAREVHGGAPEPGAFMFVDDLCISWRVGAAVYTLTVPQGGPPRIDERVAGGDEPGGGGRDRRPARGRRGKPWTNDEEARVSAAFEEGAHPSEIAELFQRSEGAVLARLVRLGLVEEAAAGLRYPVTRRHPTAADR